MIPLPLFTTTSLLSIATPHSINIIANSTWGEVGELTFDEELMRVHVEEKSGDVLVAAELIEKSDVAAPRQTIEVKLPEKLHLSIETDGDVVVNGKVEGDTTLTSKLGDITVNKLRGHNLTLYALSGSVKVSNLLEADCASVKSGLQITAKKVMGREMNISVVDNDDNIGDKFDKCILNDDNRESENNNDESSCNEINGQEFDNKGTNHGTLARIQIDSLYTTNTSTKSSVPTKISYEGSAVHSAVEVGVAHGGLEIDCVFDENDALVSDENCHAIDLKGISGFVSSSITNKSAKAYHPNKYTTKIHYSQVPKATRSSISSDCGDVEVSFSEGVECTVDMLACGFGSSIDITDGVTFISQEAGEGNKIIKGRVKMDASLDSNTPNFNQGAGKISFDAAGSQSLHAFTQNGMNDSKDKDDDGHISIRSSGNNTIRLKGQDSWIDNIAKSLGIDMATLK